ncbi:MAG: TetR family transcriptional regulator [Myxococcota bacterium]
MSQPQSPPADTRQRILHAAEQLFRSRGPGSTSLRSITAAAGVNVAAVHYHFGGREALAREVFARTVAPVNEERLRRLDALEAAPDGPGVEAIVRALIEPVFAEARRDPSLRELSGVLLTEPEASGRALVEELFGEVMRRFHAALARALPTLGPDEIADRIVFSIGSFAQVLAGRHPARPDGTRVAPDPLSCDRLIAFLTAGLTAPPARAERP